MSVGPVLEFDTQEIRIRADETRRFREQSKRPVGVFHLRNSGDADLSVHVDFVSCRCSLPDFKDDLTIKPGQSSPLSVEGNIPQAGEAIAAVNLSTNSATLKQTRIRLIVECDKTAPYLQKIEPRLVVFEGEVGQTVSRDLICETVETTEGPWITRVLAGVPGLNVAKPIVRDDGDLKLDGSVVRTYRFRLELKLGSESMRSSIQLCAGDGSATIESILLQTRAASKIVVSPTPVMIFASTADEGRVFRAIVRSKLSNESLRLTLKSPPPDWLGVSLSENANAALQTLELTLLHLPPSDLASFDLVLDTNCATCPTLTVPIVLVRSE